MAGKRDERPRHQQVSADLRARIMSGDLPPGTQLPSTSQLVERYGAANATIHRAVAALKNEGLAIQSGISLTTCPADLQPQRRWKGWKLPEGVPVIRQLRVIYSDAERPVEASVLVKGAHLYALQYRQAIPEGD